jgi:hypothetical protein
LWREQPRDWLLMKFAVFCGRMSPESLQWYLDDAKKYNCRLALDAPDEAAA